MSPRHYFARLKKEYQGSTMNQLFAQRRNLFRPGHNRLLTHLRYFGYIFNPIPV